MSIYNIYVSLTDVSQYIYTINVYRKKRSRFLHKQDWKHAQNYVAKIYMENVERDVYFEDVLLQMDAKLWGEEYNRHNPPKQASILCNIIIIMLAEHGLVSAFTLVTIHCIACTRGLCYSPLPVTLVLV